MATKVIEKFDDRETKTKRQKNYSSRIWKRGKEGKKTYGEKNRIKTKNRIKMNERIIDP